MTLNYFTDRRPLLKDARYECCDCRNTLFIKFLDRYPHGPDLIRYCPVCGADGQASHPSFRLTSD